MRIVILACLLCTRISAQDSLRLFYHEPATDWMQALPIGNGFLGAMVYGGVQEELLKLNHDEFWSGEPSDFTTPEAVNFKDSVAALVRQEKYTQADQLMRNMQGPYSQAYMPLADLRINFEHSSHSEYERKLNISNATAQVTYMADGSLFQRNYFVSYPDSLLVGEFSSSVPALLSFQVSLSSVVKHRLLKDEKKLVLQVKAPRHAEPNYRTQFTDEEAVQYDDWNGRGTNAYVYVIVEQEGGSLSITDTLITVESAEKATLKVIAGTSYSGFNMSPSVSGKNARVICDRVYANVAKRSIPEVLAAHKKDYKSLFRRLEIDLGRQSEVSTDMRLRSFAKDEDPALVALLFQYGRYLLISSSRPGSQAANLQGIWSKSTRPPWSSNYTQNINTEMNYWPAEVCNLSELAEPLFSHLKKTAETGKSVARANYGLQGWVSHHNGDIWGHSAPVGGYGEGDPVWANWAMGGAWMCQHIWEHYLFTGDEDFLSEHYYLLKGASLFLIDLLDENDNKKLETIFGTSPENQFYDPATSSRVSVTRGVAMDLAITNELLNNTMKAAAIIGEDDGFQALLLSKIERLQPFRISERGILMEWNKDFREVDSTHRHLSHLYGLFPGNQINPWDTPKEFSAARKSLVRRGDAATGWSMGWKTNLWARSLDGNHAYRIIKNLFTPIEMAGVRMGGGGLYMNLLDAHPPFQIDGNFGVTAGIAEMLVQSHNGAIHILPALPDAWPKGSVQGLKVRGNAEVDIKWEEGRLQEIQIVSKLDGPLTLRSEWPLDFPANTDGKHNPLLDYTDISEPEIYGNPQFNIDLRKYYTYQLTMKAGESRLIRPL